MRAEGVAGGGDLFLPMPSARVVSVGTQCLGARGWGGNATSVWSTLGMRPATCADASLPS